MVSLSNHEGVPAYGYRLSTSANTASASASNVLASSTMASPTASPVTDFSTLY